MEKENMYLSYSNAILLENLILNFLNFINLKNSL